MAKKSKQAVPAVTLQAQGKGKKRTPQPAFDPAAGKDVYEPEKIVASQGGQVAQPGQDGQAIFRSACVVGRCGARLQCGRQDARRSEQAG